MERDPQIDNIDYLNLVVQLQDPFNTQIDVVDVLQTSISIESDI